MPETKRARRPSFRGRIPIQGVRPVPTPYGRRQRTPVDLTPYIGLLNRAEKQRRGRKEEKSIEFTIPAEAQQTLRTRLNQAGEILDLGVRLIPSPEQNGTPDSMLSVVLTTGPRRRRGTTAPTATDSGKEE